MSATTTERDETRLDPVTDLFVLPTDVVVVPVHELSERVRRALPAGGVTLSRPGYRAPSRWVDSATADLLAQFREPTTIPAAVVSWCCSNGGDPLRVLEEAFATLQVLTSARLLVPAGSEDADEVRASWAPGQQVLGLDILALLQVTTDSEVYRARTADGMEVAVKIVQPDAPPQAHEAMEREVDALRRIAGRWAPALIDEGHHDGRRYAVVEWFPGAPLDEHGTQIRQAQQPGWRQRLHHIACRAADLVAHLHDEGIVHGDLHPRNVLVGPNDEVKLIDFGLSVQPGRPEPYSHGLRVGFAQYLDSESAQALIRGRELAPACPVTERYALAALLVLLYTGRPYLSFGPELDAAYRQVVNDPPEPFVRLGFETWRSVEDVLRRALAKDRAERYCTTTAFAQALTAARPPAGRAATDTYDRLAGSTTDRLLEELTGRPGGEAACALGVPVDRGAAGVAWFLLRVAQLRGRADLLDEADLWCARANSRRDDQDAFPPEDARAVIGPASMLHRAAGVDAVQAFIQHARGDLTGLRHAVGSLHRHARIPSPDAVDLTLGSSGAAVMLAGLLDAVRSTRTMDPAELHQAGTELLTRLDAVLTGASSPGLTRTQPASYAHGWPGIAEAYLRTSQALGSAVPPPVHDRLTRIADDLSVAAMTAARAPLGTPPSWCNGSAGWIQALVCLHTHLGRDDLLDAAVAAAHHAVQHPARHPHVCCGLAGRAASVAGLYRVTGSEHWLDRARRLASMAWHEAEQNPDDQPLSLFRGRLGVVLVLEELRHPEAMAFPVFGDLRWQPGRSRTRAGHAVDTGQAVARVQDAGTGQVVGTGPVEPRTTR
ncbi:MAG: lanthionine synthetase LanC family protein [Actinomycetales bacterium]